MLCYSLAVCCGTMWWARPETRPYAEGEAAKGATTNATAGAAAGNGAMDTGAWAGGVVELTADVQVEAEASATVPAAALEA